MSAQQPGPEPGEVSEAADAPATPDVSTAPASAQVGVVDRISRFLALLSGAACLLMGVHVFVDVVSRAAFNAPLSGTIDYVQYWWMPCIAFLALGHAQALDQHIRVTILIDKLPARPRRLVDALTLLLMAGTIAMLVGYGWIAAVDAWEVGEASLGTAVVPIWPFKFVAVLGMVAFVAQILVMLGRKLRETPGADDGRNDSPSELKGI